MASTPVVDRPWSFLLSEFKALQNWSQIVPRTFLKTLFGTLLGHRGGQIGSISDIPHSLRHSSNLDLQNVWSIDHVTFLLSEFRALQNWSQIVPRTFLKTLFGPILAPCGGQIGSIGDIPHSLRHNSNLDLQNVWSIDPVAFLLSEFTPLQNWS